MCAATLLELHNSSSALHVFSRHWAVGRWLL